MPMDTPWMEQELLAHAAWVRELARGLVGDEQGAEDLAQDTFVVALRGTPRARASMRSWLAGIARRLAWKRHRDRRRELSLDDSGIERAATSSAQSIEQLELHELLARELRDLREPLRATLIERYVHGCSAAEIAQRSGVPLPTVRSRLQQGLEELRSRLDRKFEGDRETWMSALTLAAGSKGAVLGGGLLVSTLAKVSIGLGVLILGALLAKPFLSKFGGPRPEASPLANSAAGLSSPEPTVIPEGQTGGARVAQLQPGSTRPLPVEMPSVRLRGRCVDPMGQPVGDVAVSLISLCWWSTESGGQKFLLSDDPSAAEVLPRVRSAPDGSFSISTRLPEASPWGVQVRIEARKPGYCRGVLDTGSQTEKELDLDDIVLGPGTRAGGIVRDAQGKRCAGAYLYITSTAVSGPQYTDLTRSTSDGSFVFENAPAAACNAEARTDDLREGKLAVDLSSGEPRLDLELVLPDLHGTDSISGVVVDPLGKPVARAALLERTTSGPEPALSSIATCDDQGRFRIDGRPESLFELVAYDKAGAWAPVRKTEIRSGTHDIVLQLDGTRTFLLRVHDASGTPIERFAWDRRSEAWVWQGGNHDAQLHAGGELRLPSDLAPFDLRIRAPGWRTRAIGPLDPASMPAIVDVVLERACVLRGSVHSIEASSSRAMVSVVEPELRDPEPSTRMGPAGTPTEISNLDGSFEITVEGTGSVRLQAQRTGAISAASAPIAVRPGQDVEGIVLELTPSGTIEGVVVRADGAPASGINIIASQAGQSLRSVPTDGKGRFKVFGLASGRYDLSAAVPQRSVQFDAGTPPAKSDPQRWTCDVQAGRTSRSNIVLLETVRLRITLDLPKPTNASWNMQLYSCTAGSRRLDIDDHETSGTGKFDFEFVDPVHAELRMDCVLKSWPQLYAPWGDLERGAHDLPIAFRAGRIEGQLADASSASGVVKLSWQSGLLRAWAEAQPDAAGHFVFECAPEGECTIQRAEDAGTSKKILVKAGETARVDGL